MNTSNSKNTLLRPWLATTFLFLASFINLLDVTIINTALPVIQDQLGATDAQLQWVAAAYVMAFAAMLLPFGRYGDTFGRKRVFMSGLVGFTLSSLVCGLAPNPDSLIAARAIQGATAAMMVSQVLAFVHVMFAASDKGKVFSLFGTMTSFGAIVGPVLGGAIVSADIFQLGWRPVFLINLPLGVIAIIGTMLFVPANKPSERTGLDIVSALVFILATCLFVYPTIEGRNLGWPWWSIAMLIMSLPVFFAFFRRQILRARNGLPQLLPAHLVQNKNFFVGVIVTTLFFSSVPGMIFVMMILLQSGFGFSPLQSGLATLAFPISVMLVTLVSAKFKGVYLKQRVAVGAVTLIFGMLSMRSAVSEFEIAFGIQFFVLPMAICGIAMGLVVSAIFQAVLSSVAQQDAGAGSGALQAFQHVGSASGIAVAGQIFFERLSVGADAATFQHAAASSLIYPVISLSLVCVLSFLWMRIDSPIAQTT